MDFKVKSAELHVKAAGADDGLEDGHFEAYASVFGNKDSYGDVVTKGAFVRTLGEWAEKGETIPVLWGHDMNDPFANIGGVLEASEDDHGLKISGQLDLDNPTAAQVYRLLKGRRTNRMSFAYSVRDGEDSDEGYLLKDLDLYEVSIVQVPANELAEVTLVKDAASILAKAGKVLSATNETKVREAISALQDVLAANGAEDVNDQEKASGTAEAKPGASDEEPSGTKSSASDEELTPSPSASESWRRKYNIYAAAFAGQEGAQR